MNSKKRSPQILITILISFLLLVVLSACGSDSEPTPTETQAPEPTKAKISGGGKSGVEEVTPAAKSGAVSSLDQVEGATIQIEAQGTFMDPDFGLQANVAGRGSGFIIDPSGIAVTNNHVVAGAALLQVWVGGETDPRNARILGVSECFDLAVIQVNGEDFPYLDWHEGDIGVGLDVYTAGFPLGDPEFTLTRGIVSKARADGESTWSSIDHVLEHDAVINPGNSGGPLINSNGNVVGVNYAGIWDANQYFAISRDQATPVVEQLRNGEDVFTIGINAVAVANSSGTITGIWVASVASGSPADDAGIRPGDIIITMEGLTMAMDGTMDAYCDVLRTHGQDATLSIEVLRYSTGETLSGQINGRVLEVTSTGTGTGPSGGATYGSYMSIQDDSGSLTVDVPSEWLDIDGGTLYDEEVLIGPAIFAAPNLTGLTDTWDVPGLEIFATDAVTYVGGSQGLLETEMDFFSQFCTFDGLYDYSDPLYFGQYAVYADCGGAGGASMAILVAEPTDDSASFLILVEVQIVADRDWEAFQHILDSFVVSGDLTAVSGPTGGNGDFTLIADDYGAIELEVPNWWNDVDGGAWVLDGDVVGASIWAAPDLEGFITTWDTPGVMFEVSDDLASQLGYVQLLDAKREELLGACEWDSREDYEDALYRGKFDLYNKCGGAGGPWYMVLSAVSHVDQFSYLIRVEVQIVSDEDWDIAQHVLDTFVVVGDLP
jgi:serine protease Do